MSELSVGGGGGREGEERTGDVGGIGDGRRWRRPLAVAVAVVVAMVVASGHGGCGLGEWKRWGERLAMCVRRSSAGGLVVASCALWRRRRLADRFLFREWPLLAVCLCFPGLSFMGWSSWASSLSVV